MCFLAHRKADESGHKHFCSTQLAIVGVPRTGPAAGELALELLPELALDEIWCPIEMWGSRHVLK